MKEVSYFKAKKVIDSCDSVSQVVLVGDISNNSIRCLEMNNCTKDF